MKPLFLFSLPRSGSTLVQRVLAAHPSVATASEPWLLLPHLYAGRSDGARAEYWHESAAEAVRDFAAALPGGEADYRDELRAFALRLYEKAAGDADYFLDKTPHYHVIARDVMDLFPDGRFVFLWRNPLSVLASCLETFRESRWEPDLFSFDLHDGVANLTDAWAAADGRAHAVRYEDLVGEDAERRWRELFAYLALEFDPALLTRFTETRLQGRYGDPTGMRRYGELSTESVEKWKHVASGRWRRAWCLRYLRWVGPDRMGAMGYDHAALVREVQELPSGGTGAVDALHWAGAFGREKLRRTMLRLPDSPRPRGPAFEPDD